ncbi:stalk domain-containing protein [Paenibacillus tarimensis]|uniref:stalk domain-containing protein n=1 Tax=Paenibacillus tarimensis TaxID=416012 RepID=UPI001EEA35B5|nr:stalk domain-containing protein [Paenibacillus tarimensis]MCF2943604.1 trypsin-like peptidase domain-containing protein [Paenibacillus tarimensis]
MITTVKKLVVALFAAAVVALPVQAAVPQAAAAAQSVSGKSDIIVYVDGKKVAFSQAPVQKKGTTLVPMRPVFSALKAQVIWEQQTKTIIASKGRTTITLRVGSSTAVINGKNVKLSTPAEVIGGSAMVPLRFISEAFGADISWNAKNRTITIESLEYQYEAERDNEANTEAASPAKPAAKPLTSTELVELNDDKVVMIMTDYGQGSGVVIGDHWILTNYHVMEGATEGEVLLNNGSHLTIQGVAVHHEQSDLAVIRTKEPIGIEPVKLGSWGSARKGDRVYAIGSPLGMRNTVSEGLISNIVILDNGIRYLQISAPIDHGSSGGGLFNEYGELIGITSSGIDDTVADLNFAVTIEYYHLLLEEELEEAKKKPASIAFLPSKLPATLKNASTEEIAELLNEQYSEIMTTQGYADLEKWNVTRDAEGWLVISTVMDPAFYMIYGDKASNELRLWALNLGAELKRMLPDEKIQFLVYYEQIFNAKPRGFETSEVTQTQSGNWQVRYPIIDMQILERLHIKVRD